MSWTRTVSLEYGDGFEPVCLIGRRSWSLLSSPVSGCAHTVSQKGNGLAPGREPLNLYLATWTRRGTEDSLVREAPRAPGDLPGLALNLMGVWCGS
jgi:hypothetical protein